MKLRETTKGEEIYDTSAIIYCLRNSHKGIIIGKKEQCLKNSNKCKNRIRKNVRNKIKLRGLG